jgi:hypothetical protein
MQAAILEYTHFAEELRDGFLHVEYCPTQAIVGAFDDIPQYEIDVAFQSKSIADSLFVLH